MGIKGEALHETILRWAVHLGVIVIAIVVTLFAFVFKQPCDIDKIYLYCRVHPTTGFDIAGIILFYAGCFGLSGLWMFFTGDIDQSPGRTVAWISLVLGIAGMGLMWA